MFGISYETWKSVCDIYFDQKDEVLQSHLQWFPFSILSDANRITISSQEYYETNIKSGACVLFNETILHTDNYLQKSDGSFRNSSLVSPIIFLILQAIGKTVSESYLAKRPSGIFTYYAGNYEEMRCSYKHDYNEFFNHVNTATEVFSHFIRTDIRDFFTSINPDTLMHCIDGIVNVDTVQISQKHLLLYKELLTFCGTGRFPIIENCVACSYLATVVYLDEIDCLLHDYIIERVPEITSFFMIRYVDDLYIFLNSDMSDKELSKIYNDIRNVYSSIMKKYGLALNTQKCCLKPVSKINEELRKSLYNEYVNDIKCEIAQLCPNGMVNFIERLKDELASDHLSIEKYNEIIDASFSLPDVECTPDEIFNYYVYNKNDILQSPQIVNAINELVQHDTSFISLDPKRLTIMIMKCKSDVAIRGVLNDLFIKYRAGKWNSYDTSIAINYLIQGRFRHRDLLLVISEYCPPLYHYYLCNCRGSFVDMIHNSEINKLITVIQGNNKTYYLYFMYIVEQEKSNIMSAFAFFKNYFDRISAQLAFKSGYDNNGRRPNYNRFYKEGELIRFYEDIADSVDIIAKSHKLRNSNPLSHSSADLIDDNNSSNDLLKSISDLKSLISCKLDLIEDI